MRADDPSRDPEEDRDHDVGAAEEHPPPQLRSVLQAQKTASSAATITSDPEEPGDDADDDLQQQQAGDTQHQHRDHPRDQRGALLSRVHAPMVRPRAALQAAPRAAARYS